MSHPKSSTHNNLTGAPSGYIGSPDYPLEFPAHLYEEDIAEIRQLSQYDSNNKAAPDNNMFFEERSNPLSSKGD